MEHLQRRTKKILDISLLIRGSLVVSEAALSWSRGGGDGGGSILRGNECVPGCTQRPRRVRTRCFTINNRRKKK